LTAVLAHLGDKRTNIPFLRFQLAAFVCEKNTRFVSPLPFPGMAFCLGPFLRPAGGVAADRRSIFFEASKSSNQSFDSGVIVGVFRAQHQIAVELPR
jgi:hypothetical protein